MAKHKDFETEYRGITPESTVTDLGPEQARKLSTSERLRLSYLTGQDEAPREPVKPGFFYGVDPDFPENPNA